MSEIDHTKILEELEQKGYTRFIVEEWDFETRTNLVNLLKRAGFAQYEFNKIEDEENSYAIVLKNIQNMPPYSLEKIYTERSVLSYLLPLIIIAIIIAFTAIFAQSSKALMAGSFVLGIPIVLGGLVEYVCIIEQPKSNFFNGLVVQPIVLAVILVFAVIILREGTICLIIIAPLVFIALLIGALLMRFICQYFWKPSPKIYSLAILPLLLWLILPDLIQTQYGKTQRSVVIHAPAEQVFYAIQNIGNIQPEEVKSSPIFWMGFPKPVFGMTEQRKDETIRTIQWERGIKFEEIVQAKHPPYLLSWTYKFDKNSFPKGSVDDHIEMGGKYFDLLKTDYQLEKIDERSTKLILTIDYRLSTEYNWYSQLWSNYILGEFSDVVMNIHKQRLEKN
ncbi:MAG: hypothetical protein I8H98_05735 [Moraxellaceae bacterium]|nr:hypothetical protein [Moraxellaceae bacterium]MBH2031071.1 hypothetical protein [Moraxellaceae bacterium]